MADAEAVSSVEDLYKNFGVLADAKEKAGEFPSAYEAIIKGSRGGAAEKKLASGFITRFYRFFPALSEVAMDAMLDLIEDEDPQIRRQAIKTLPDICKGTKDSLLANRVSDILTQLLLSEDAVDLDLVKSAMATILQMDTQGGLAGVFSQIAGEEEGVRGKAIEYVSSSLMNMRHKLFLPHVENEKYLLQQIKKVLSDVTSEEFEVFVEVLGKLQYISSPEGAQEAVDAIGEQAQLSSDFNPTDGEAVDRFITCFTHALKFCKRGGSAMPFLEYVCTRVLPAFSNIPEQQTRQHLVRLLAEGSMFCTEECVDKCIQPLFDFLVEYAPHAPTDDGAPPPKLFFSVVEGTLFALHQFLQKKPDILAAPESEDRLKDFRQRLQYLARRTQTYNTQLQATLQKTGVVDMKTEQNKLRAAAVKTTANITVLIKDFFHNPPVYKTSIQLSWGAKKPEDAPVRKRLSTEGFIPPASKKKPTPISFDLPTDSAASKRQSRAVYQPPRNTYSKNIEAPADLGEGLGKGWGRRGRGRGS